MRIYKIVASTAALGTLIACSSGSSTDEIPDREEITFTNLEARALSLQSDYTADILANNFADVSVLSGTGTLSGAFGYGEGTVQVVDDLDVIGAVTLVYDFDAGRLDGNADNFFDVETEAALDGEININMEFDGTGIFDFDGVATGIVDSETLDLTARANFYREDAEFVAGLLDGTSSDGEATTEITGLFVAD